MRLCVSLLCSRFVCSCFRYDAGDPSDPKTAAGGWKEKGRGEVSLNLRSVGAEAAEAAEAEADGGMKRKARLVMRASGSKRLILNANLWPEMVITQMGASNGVTFACVNAVGSSTSGGGGGGGGGEEDGAGATKPSTYALKLPKSVKINTFIDLLNEHKKAEEQPASLAMAAK